MRIVVVGATGNVGSSLVRVLAGDERVESIVGIARRRPRLVLPKTDWVSADVVDADLASLFTGADAVVHLAWLIQPSRDERVTHRVNVDGSRRVFEAVVRAGVPALVFASSVGVYSRGPKDRFVDETWPRDGIPSSFYSRHKAEAERSLDEIERTAPELRVVRMRPGLIFKREAATGIRRLFAGPFLPGALLHPRLVPFVPLPRGLRFQAVHTDDVAAAYREAIVRSVRGPFNLAADPPLDPQSIADLFDARLLTLAPGLARSLVNALWRARLQPSPPGWVDLGLGVPLIDGSRAHEELGWSATRTGAEALAELLDGLREGATDRTPPLGSEAGGTARTEELATGVGAR